MSIQAVDETSARTCSSDLRLAEPAYAPEVRL